MGVGAGWDYTKEWVDIGTTIFGTVPFALYSANTANINELYVIHELQVQCFECYNIKLN